MVTNLTIHSKDEHYNLSLGPVLVCFEYFRYQEAIQGSILDLFCSITCFSRIFPNFVTDQYFLRSYQVP